jgi:hypothetical protein
VALLLRPAKGGGVNSGQFYRMLYRASGEIAKGCANRPISAKPLTHLINSLGIGIMNGRKRPVTESALAVLEPAM